LTPADQIIDLLKTIKGRGGDQEINQRIDYAIEKIGLKNIYEVDIIQQLDLARTTHKESQVTVGWIREFSNIHMSEVRNDYLENII
jgi:hypothetical protein